MAEPSSSAIPEGAVVVPAVGSAGPGASAKAIVALAPAPPPRECEEEATSPEPLERVEVVYPVGLPGMAGKVVARAKVAPDGSVSAVEVVGSLAPAIDRAVQESLKQWRFRPSTRCGKPVTGTFTLALSFEPTE
jgi:protein TonB